MALLAALPEIMAGANNYRKRKASGQFSLFGESGDVDESDKLPDLGELKRTQQLTFEKEMLGFYFTDHPLSLYKESLSKLVTHNIAEIGVRLVNEKVKIGGLVSNLKKVATRKDNKEMAFGRVEDESGSIEFVIFPRSYENYRSLLVSNEVIVISGKVNERDQGINIIAESIKGL